MTIPVIAPRQSGKSSILSELQNSAYARSIRAHDSARQRELSGADDNAVAFHQNALAAHRLAKAVQAEENLRNWERELQKPIERVSLKKPGLLGCWVDGVLRFQSRDHDAIYGFAADKMKPHTVVKGGKPYVTTSNVWVAPVGSFQV